MGGAGPAERLPLAVVNAVAHSHDERFDQCSLRTDFRHLAQPPGERVPDPSRVEPAGGGQPPDPGVLGSHVPLTRVTVPKQPGLIVETARVAESSRGAEPDHESPGLAGDDFRGRPSGVSVPRETQAALPVRQPVLHEKIEPGAARGGGRNGGNPPRHDKVFTRERGGKTVRDGCMGIDERPQEPGGAPAARGGPAAREREVESDRQQRGGPVAGQRFEPVQGAGAEQEGDRP